MKKKLIITLMIVMCVMLFALSASATSVVPQKPTLDVDFGAVQTIDGFTAPSDKFTKTERVLLTDENGNYVTYPTYYVTKDNTTFDFDFSKLNAAQSVQYTKKSVVMVEIPSGVTTVSNSYFAGTGNFPLCVSVQFPGTVTSYGSSMFSINTVIKVVEFLDGTEPITMGDSMFGGNWSTGPVNIQYVKFPNNLVSIGNNTFGKAKQVSKTVIFGENLETIGTGFFGESTPNSTDTILYISSKFFADTSKMFENLFGSEAPYHGNNLRLTIFYAGSQEQAQAFVDAGAAVQSGYVFSNVRFVSASEYDYATHKPTSNKSATIIYGVNTCDAFYNGVHDYQGTGDCMDGVFCENCPNNFPGTTAHTYYETLVYASFASNGVYNYGCSNEGCTKYDVYDDKVAPIFVAKGYSNSDNGIAGGYTVNITAYNNYVDVTGKTITFGVLMLNPKYLDGKDSFFNGTNVNIDGTKGYVKVDMTNLSYKDFTYSITGFGADSKDVDLVVSAFAYVDGEDVEFIQDQTTKCASKKVTKNDATLYTVTYNTVEARPGNAFADLGEYTVPEKED